MVITGRWRALIVVLLCAGLLAVAWHSGVAYYFSLEHLQDNYSEIIAFRSAHPMLTALLYVALFTLISLAALPVSLYLVIGGGAIFGAWWALVLTLVGKMVACAVIYALVRGVAGDRVKTWLEQRGGRRVTAMRRIFMGNMFVAVMVARVMPVVPFFLSSLLPPLMGMRFWPFMLASLLGLIPDNIVYAITGAGLGGTLAMGETVTLESVFSPQVIAGMAGLVVMTLVGRYLQLRIAPAAVSSQG